MAEQYSDANELFDEAKGVYLLTKYVTPEHSVFTYANTNFAELIGSTKEQVVGSEDGGGRAQHLTYDERVLNGEKFLNLVETIPAKNRGILSITTQKGPLIDKQTKKVVGVTVNFAENKQADEWIAKFNLFPIAIGGWFGVGSESNEYILRANLPERFAGDRRVYSTNYYLLRSSDVLSLHSLNQDEVWYFQYGHAIRLHIFHLGQNPKYETVVLGNRPNIEEYKDDKIHYSVPHNTWFGAELVEGGYCLASCSLSPGWDPRDSFTPTPEIESKLRRSFPDQLDVINRLSVTRITLVRHGDVENPEKIYYGRTGLEQYPLSHLGLHQADAAADALATSGITAIYSSPQLRTRQLAGHVAERVELPVQTCSLLNEVYSPFDGESQAALEARGWKIYNGDPLYEQPIDVVNRAREFFTHARTTHKGGNVVAVTHGDVIAFAVRWAKKDNIDEQRSLFDVAGFKDDYPGTGSTTTFTFAPHSEFPIGIEYRPNSYVSKL